MSTNEFKLSLTAQEIDDKLNSALTFTEQSLTDEQKNQVKKNLGIDE
jgi:hypothetical protein